MQREDHSLDAGRRLFYGIYREAFLSAVESEAIRSGYTAYYMMRDLYQASSHHVHRCMPHPLTICVVLS